MANSSTITVTLRAVADISDVLANAKQIEKAFDKVSPSLGKKLTSEVKSSFKDINSEIDKIQAKLAQGKIDKKGITEIEKSYNNITNYLKKIQGLVGEVSDLKLAKNIVFNSPEIQKTINQIDELQSKINAIKGGSFEGLNTLENSLKRIGELSKSKKIEAFNFTDLIKEFKGGDFSRLQQAIDLISNIRTKDGSVLNQVVTSTVSQLVSLKELVEKGAFNEAFQKLGQLNTNLNNLKTDAFKKVQKDVEAFETSLRNGEKTTRDYGQTFTATMREALNSADNLERLGQKLKYFFGIENAIYLARRAIRSAYQSITELDKVMTDTAVVTNFTVGDMWEKLPEYTKMANKLGATTKGAYETSTLYYQQGLNTAQVMAISTETMKMARIAGMDYADATNKMTAAIRGFNMAINEQSATRVNDVYSELAAITAADTNQIATAMTKTASIAASANMEFETTAAFLSQIIETTQEAPETAGTALKTIIARFTEVKKLYSAGDLLGQDEEGEAIDVNKIQTALRSVGISMTEFFRGEEGLDEVLLRLAEKWDTLDLATQRYIATTAAGSRQQSRFLAMMSNYGRTMELVSAANNSAGASQDQFNKTLSSLEAKINKLKNAWQEFTMGILNSDFVKFGVDVATAFLKIVNAVSDLLPAGNGLVKIILTLQGLKLGKLAFGKLFSEGGLIENLLGKTTGGVGRKILQISGLDLFFKGQSPLKAATTITTAATAAATTTTTAATAAATTTTTAAATAASTLIEGAATAAAILKANAAATMGTKVAAKGAREAQNFLLGRERAPIAFLPPAGSNEGAQIAGGALVPRTAPNLPVPIVPPEMGTGMGEKALPFLLKFVPVAAAVAATAYTAYQFSNEGQLKEAKEVASLMESTSNSAKENEKTQKNLLKDYKANADELSTIVDREKRREAILKNNETIASMIEQDSSLAPLVKKTDEGQMYFSDLSAVENQIEALTQKALFAEGASLMSQAVVSSKEARKNYDQALWSIDADSIVFEQQDQIENQAKATLQVEKALAKGFESADFSSTLSMAAAAALVDVIEKDRTVVGYGRNYAQTKHAAKLEYKQYYGVEADESWSVGEIQAQNQAAKDLERTISQYSNLLKLEDSESFLNILSGEGTASNLGEQDWSSYLKEYAKAAGISEDQAKQKFLEGYVESGNKLIIKYSKAFKILGQEIDSYNGNFTKLLNDVGRFGEDKLEILTRVGETIEGLNSPLLLESFTKSISGFAEGELISSQGFEFLEGLDQINFLNPIKGAQQLKNLINSVPSESNLQKAYTEIEKSSQNILGTAAQFKYAYKNFDDDIISKIREMREQYGKITTDNIVELIEENENLSKVLNQTEMNLISMAKALDKVASGEIKLDQITETVAASLRQLDGIENIYYKADKALEGFEEGPSGEEYEQWFATAKENTEADLKAGRIGSKRIQSYGEFIFGGSKWQEMVADGYENAVRNLYDFIEAFSTEAQGLSEFVKEGSFNISGQNVDISKNQETGFYEFRGLEDVTTDKFIEGYATFAGISEELASIILADTGVFSPDAITELKKNDFNKAIEDAIAQMIDQGDWAISDQELKAIGAIFGKDKTEVWNKFVEIWGETSNVPSKDIKNLNFFNEDGSYNVGSEQDGFDWLLNQSITQGEKFDLNDMNRSAAEAVAENKGLDLDTYLRSDLMGRTDGYRYNYGKEEYQKLDDDGNWVKAEQQEIINAWAANYQKYKPDQASSLFNELSDFIVETEGYNIDTALEEGLKQGLSETQVFEGLQKQLESTGQDSAELFINGFNQQWTSDGPTVQQLFDKTKIWEEQQAILEFWSNQENGNNIPGINIPLNIDTNSSDLTTAINTIVAKVTPDAVVIPVKYGTPEGSPGGVGGAGGGSVATGGYVSSCASGSANRKLSPGPALTGEEGAEIVWNKEQGYAYITGTRNPQFTNLKPGDRIFNASETKKILKEGHFEKIQGAAPGGYISYPGNYLEKWKSGTGSGGRSSKIGGDWDNPYDELYNLTEKINEALRDREKLERQYDRLLENRNASYIDLIRNTLDSLANLRKEIALQQALQAGRARQLENIGQQTYRDKDKKEKTFAESDVMQYAQYDSTTGLLQIDWEGIEAVTDENKGAAIEAYISKLEELVEQYEETEKTIADMEDTLEEIRDRGKEQYLEFEDRIYEALVEREQKLIDEYEDVSNTINDSNSRILDGLRESIELSRQIRDNTQTEEDIADKEARLAYLRRDTSGANQLEIQQLEEELKEIRQSYSDSLVDQELDRLNQVNETANEQRERQIEIANAQLEWLEQSGYFWDETYALLEGAFNEDGTLNNNSALVNLLKETDGFKGMSEFGSYDWIVKLIQEFNEAESGYSSWMLDKAEDQGYIEGTSVGKLIYDRESGKWTGDNGKEYTTVWNEKKNDWDVKEVKTDTSTEPSYNHTTTTTPTITESKSKSKDKKPYTIMTTYYKVEAGSGKIVEHQSDSTYYTSSKKEAQELASESTQISWASAWQRSNLAKKIKTGRTGVLYEYATGGLNTRTGPAILDGTPSRPEYVLNAEQTGAFLQLADVLPALMSNNSISTSTSSGDNYFDININVDSISSDYDVDRLTERIKQNIYEDGAYRNVNVINRLR